MKDDVMDINALPTLLFKLFSTAKVSVTETSEGIHIVPAKDDSSIDGLMGILADYPEMSLDNFMARKRADEGLDR